MIIVELLKSLPEEVKGILTITVFVILMGVFFKAINWMHEQL